MTSPSTELQWVKPPLQARSQHTLERLLDASEALIIERGLEKVTVADIAKRAGSSVGAFYSRFDDKEALLRCVFQRFYEQAVATIDDIAAPERWESASLPMFVDAAMRFLLQVFRDRRQLIVAFTLHATRDGELGSVGEALGHRITERMVALLEQRNEVVGHPDREQAVGFVVWLILSALEARALYSPRTIEPIPDEMIAAELSRMALAYLGVESQ